jgi:hypothetical protein
MVGDAPVPDDRLHLHPETALDVRRPLAVLQALIPAPRGTEALRAGTGATDRERVTFEDANLVRRIREARAGLAPDVLVDREVARNPTVRDSYEPRRPALIGSSIVVSYL